MTTTLDWTEAEMKDAGYVWVTNTWRDHGTFCRPTIGMPCAQCILKEMKDDPPGSLVIGPSNGLLWRMVGIWRYKGNYT